MIPQKKLGTSFPLWLRWYRICLQRRKPRFNPWVRRSPGEGSGNSLQYSCQRNSMERGACRLQFIRLQRVGHARETNTFTFLKKVLLPCTSSYLGNRQISWFYNKKGTDLGYYFKSSHRKDFNLLFCPCAWCALITHMLSDCCASFSYLSNQAEDSRSL